MRKPSKSAAFRFTALNGTNHRKGIVKYLDTTYNLLAAKRIYYQQNAYEKSIGKCAPTPSEKKIFDTLKELKAIYFSLNLNEYACKHTHGVPHCSIYQYNCLKIHLFIL